MTNVVRYTYDDGRDTTQVRARKLLAVRAVWLAPIAIAAILMLFMTMFYIGAIVNPGGHLSGLPVVMVNEDQGATTQGGHVNFGAEVAADLLGSHPVTSRLALREVTPAQAEARMDSGEAFADIVVPCDFSASLLSAYGLTPAAGTTASASRSCASTSSEPAEVPTVELLTNPRAGGTGVQLATGVAQPALLKVSYGLGRSLTAEAARLGRTPSGKADASDPLTLVTSDFRALPPNSAIGLSAFYISLLAIMCGFLGAVLVNSSIDTVLGYGPSEVGPRWRHRLPVGISRWQTLLTKWAVTAAAVPVLTGVLVAVAAGLLHMNTPHAGELWLFASFAGIAIAAGTLAMFAAFGSLGQLLAMLLFVYLALASSGGTIPVQALPSFFRFAAAFEPLRQVLGGVRSILYFNAQADAGLTRGVVLSSIWLVFWVIIGAAVTRWYDHKGLDRLNPDVLEFIQRSARPYIAQAQHPMATGPSHDPAPIAGSPQGSPRHD